MRKLFALLVFLALASGAHAEIVTESPGATGSGGGPLVDLGTSASSTNPQRAGDSTTGLYSDTAGTVDTGCSGINCMTVNATGVGIGTTLPNSHLNTVNAVATTLTTAVTQGWASGSGWYLPFNSTGALSVGQIVGGNAAIQVPTVIGYIANGTSAVTTTASGSWSGQNLTVASGTGIVAGMLMYDTTTPANIPNQCVVNQNSAGVLYTPCTVNITNGDTIVFYPTITLSQQTTQNVAAGTSITFTNAGSDAQFNGATILSNLTVGGQIQIFQSTTNPSNGLETGPSQPLITVNGARFLNTYTPPGTNGGNLYMGGSAGPTGNPGGYGTEYQGTNNTSFGQGGIMSNITTGGSNTGFGFDACANITGGGENTCLGTGALLNNQNGNSNIAIGYNTLLNTTGSNNIAVTGYGGGSSSALVGGSNNLLLGFAVGQTTLSSGNSNILIGTSTATDTAASGTSFELNVANTVTGTLSGGTNPSICAVGVLCRLGHLTSANMNVTTDQAIAIGPLTSGNIGYVSAATKYAITEIDFSNCSASPGTAAGGFYTATSKGGTIVGAVTTTFTNCTSSITRHRLTGLTNEDTSLFTAATFYLSLTSSKGSAGTADVDIWGILYN